MADNPAPHWWDFDFPEDGFGKEALTAAELAEAAADIDPDPSPAKAEAGNYSMGHVTWKGIPLTIETAKGGVRKGTAKNGRPWSVTMTAHYGYAKGTQGKAADKDHFDVFLADDDLDSEVVFVINQKDPSTGEWDELKAVLGTSNAARAEKVYRSNYTDGWQGFDGIHAQTLDQFKWFLEHGDLSKPVRDGYFAANRRKVAADREEDDPLDGIYVWVEKPKGFGAGAHEGRRCVIDVMDWGDSKVGRKLVEAAEATGWEVTLQNEGSRPEPHEDFTRLDDWACDARRCPECGGEALTGEPDTGTKYRGSARCGKCDKGFVARTLPVVREHVPITVAGLLACLERPGKRREALKSATTPAAPDQDALSRHDNRPFVVVVDLDGTLADDSQPFDRNVIGEPLPDRVRWLPLLRAAGAWVCVQSVRGDAASISGWLDAHGIAYDSVNEHPFQPPGASAKLFADFAIDDRAWNADDPLSWARALTRATVGDR